MLLTGEKIFIRPFQDWDGEALRRLVKRNKTFWGETEPEWGNGYYRFPDQNPSARNSRNGITEPYVYTFGIFDNEEHTLIGIICLYDTRRGPFQSASAGCSIDKGQVGKGVGTQGLALVLEFAFKHLNLNRVSAEVMPRNNPSIRILEKSGFQHEGCSRESVLIKGVWEDHLQYSILKREWEQN